MAKVVLTWIPEDEEWFSEKIMEDNIDDGSDVFDMFYLWKRQMSFLGYEMGKYILEETEETEECEV